MTRTSNPSVLGAPISTAVSQAQSIGWSSDLVRLWKVSALVWPDRGPSRLWRRGRFLVRALLRRREIEPFLRSGEKGLGRLIASRPQVIGALDWPYLCITWGPTERLARIRDHYVAVESTLNRLDFPVDGELELLTLDDRMPGLRVVLDQPRWFIREGQLVLDLFRGETRLFSLAFSLGLEPDLVAYVGAIQGRDFEGVLEVYRDLTHALHGMRPRDFLIEVFGLFCQAAGIARILAVSDACRQHRDSYFGPDRILTQNYDEIWAERGGVLVSPEFYALPVGGKRRDIADVPSKKRSMYRKRYELLDHAESRIREVLS